MESFISQKMHRFTSIWNYKSIVLNAMVILVLKHRRSFASLCVRLRFLPCISDTLSLITLGSASFTRTVLDYQRSFHFPSSQRIAVRFTRGCAWLRSLCANKRSYTRQIAPARYFSTSCGTMWRNRRVARIRIQSITVQLITWKFRRLCFINVGYILYPPPFFTFIKKKKKQPRATCSLNVFAIETGLRYILRFALLSLWRTKFHFIATLHPLQSRIWYNKEETVTITRRDRISIESSVIYRYIYYTSLKRGCY